MIPVLWLRLTSAAVHVMSTRGGPSRQAVGEALPCMSLCPAILKRTALQSHVLVTSWQLDGCLTLVVLQRMRRDARRMWQRCRRQRLRRPSRHHLRATQRSQFTIVSPHTLAMSQACLAPQRATCGVRPRHRGGRQPRVAAAASSQSRQQREAGGATPAARVAPPAAATRVSVAIRQCARFPCPRNPYPCRIHKSGWCACPGVCGGLDGGIGCCGDCGSKSRWL